VIALIPPSRYREAIWHSHEQAGLFRSAWMFVGMKFELEGLIHRGVKVGDTELLIQRDATGQPRAFLNVCSHRHAQLCGHGLHQGAVRCPYHGWVYDREGLPVGIPGKAAFPAVVASPQSHRLFEFACECAGEFIFVRLADTGCGLADYLGESWSFLQEISQGMTGLLDDFRAEVQANWKVVIENSLEGYHVPAVHNNTFMHVQGMDLAGFLPVDYLDDPRHSHMTHRANPDWVARFSRMEKKIGRWPNRFEHYFHRLVFPNLTITSFMGYSFHVQVFEPSDIERTTVHSRTIGVNFEGQNPTGAAMIERMHADGHVFTRQVFEEDASICAKVQAGIRQARRPAQLGEGVEDRVVHFQRAYIAHE
jgi:phenylpropionate dioxygenase-like ring-hydroxylating dioxygenase large terminal subunit